jgi:glyoxylase-like metal-dependent hydrolase (beta-lactamase superfamily II)
MMRIINAGDRVMNTWIYEIPDGYVMIDTGYPGKLKSVEKRMKRHGIRWSDIRCLFLTHAHDDYAGFLNELMEKCPHISVIANPDSLPVLRKGRNPFIGGCSTVSAFLFCKCMSLWGKGKHLFPPLSDAFGDRIMWITEETRDALETRIGGKILFTPGHTGDSVSLKVGRVIFPGDAAMNGFPSSRRITIWVENPAAFGRSWDLLISEDADMLYPAHGKPFAKEELVRFRQAVDRIRLYALE